jgi:hypothetical protein
MRRTGENKLGYVAIGDAVLNQINGHEEISRESLIQILDKQAEEVSSDEKRKQLSLGQSLLRDSTMSPD